MQKLTKLSILASYSGQGGVEVVTNKLCQGLLNAGIAIDLLMVKSRGPHVTHIPDGVNKIKFKKSSSRLCLPELTAYLKSEKPAIMLAAKHRGVKLAIQAKKHAKTNTLISGQIHTNTSLTFHNKSWLKRQLRFHEMRKYYTQLDSLIGVSGGVIEDINTIIHNLPEHNTVLANPLFDDSIYQQAAKGVNHEWINNSGTNNTPIIMTAGRLTAQKDFKTLLNAFAVVRKKFKAKLLIIGEGELKNSLVAQAKNLGVDTEVSFVDFQKNLPAWIDKCDLFVCSSAWEGLGNVVAEALALGKPIVSTDCISGPRTILENGKFGKLVAVGDSNALANSIVVTLQSENAQDKEGAISSSQRFHLDTSAQSYITHFEQILNSSH